MAKFGRSQRDRRWVEVDLPTRTREEFDDVIEGLDGGLPDTVIYKTRIPYSVPVSFERPQSSGERFAEAWIDFPRGHAVVKLNGDLYADTPAEGLVEEAERVLAQWALGRRTVGSDDAAAPDVP